MKKTLFFLVVIFSFFSCSVDDIFIPPNVVTKDAENLPGGGVQLIGNFNNFGEDDVLGFQLYSSSSAIFENVQNPISGTNSIIIESGLYKNRAYTYRAFVQSQDSMYVGLNKSFISTGSKSIVFNKIEPSLGNFGTEVKLLTASKIENLTLKDVEVFFNNKKAFLIGLEENAIICNVPNFEDTPIAEIKINFLGDLSPTNLKFTLLKPEITAVSPKEVTFNDKVVITGNNFTKFGDYLNVYINDTKCIIHRKSETSVEVWLPEKFNAKSLDIRIESNLQDVTLKDALTVKQPTISSIPTEINIREIMIIEGSNFHPLGKHTKVYLDDNDHFLVNWVNNSWYPTKIGITVQDRVFKDWNVEAKVVILETFETTTFDVLITDPIIKIKDDYNEVLTNYNCDFNGNKYVFGLNNNNQMVFHQFNKETDEFYNKKTLELPLNTVNSVVYNGGYIYLRNNAEEENYYRINMQNFSVEILEDFNGNQSATPFYIDANKIIYKFQKRYSSAGVDLFEYNVNTNSWSSRKDNTTATLFKIFKNNFGKTYFLEGIYSAVKDIYIFDGTEFKKSNLELPAGFKDYFSEIIFENNKFYFIERGGRANNTNRLMVLDMNTNKWTEYKDFLFDDISILNSFKVNNFIFLEAIDQFSYKKELYKLDLNKL